MGKTPAEPRRTTFIKEWREHRGISQEELGHRMGGMTGGNVSLLERGLIDYSRTSLENAADALDCSVIDLLTRKPDDSEQLWKLWQGASDDSKRDLTEIARTILKPANDE